MSAKPTCPDCGSGVSLMYIGAVVIDTEEGSVTHGGVTGGVPIQWDCFSCESFERTDRLEELSADLAYWLSVSYPKAGEVLEAGSDWQLRR